MKSSDLMLKDWVRAKTVDYVDGVIKYVEENKRATTAMIHQLYNQETGILKDSLYSIQVEPIKLTAEILEKNGFVKFGENAYFFRRCGGDGEIKIKVIDLTCGEWELYAMDYDKYSDTRTSFSKELSFLKVHELQHALKLCGIEKEIIL